MTPSLKQVLAASAAVCAFAAVSAQAGLVFTIENPGVKQTTVAGAVTETFDSLPTGLLGTYVSPTTGGTYVGGQIHAPDQYGGAGGTGNYDVVGLGNTTSQTISFASGKTYFGMWWSAGDAANQLAFYDGATLLGSYVIGDIIPQLSNAYLGNPSGPFAGQNTPEYYCYLDFTTTGGSLIDRIVIDNVTISGFESDNHSVYDKPITPPGNPVPDAGSSAMLLAGAVGALTALRRKLS